MTYEEFVKGISEHPKGWRYGYMSGEIYISASSSIQEDVRVIRDTAHFLYDTFTSDPGIAVKMLKSRSDFYTAAVETWLQQ